MSQTGQTADIADIWLNTLRGVGFAAPLICFQMHKGAPSDGTTNVSTVTDREAATYSAASGGTMALTGGGPLWNISGLSTNEVINYLSGWTGLDGDDTAKCFGTGALLKPQTIANGDRVNLGTCPIAFPSSLLAS